MTIRVNLLPIECTRTREQRRQATLWIAGSIIVLVFLLMVQQVINLSSSKLRFELDSARATIAHIEQTNSKMTEQRASIATLQRDLELGSLLEQADVPLALLQVIGDSCFALGTSVRLDSLRMEETETSPTHGSKAAPKKNLTLVGSGMTDDSVSTFVALLQASRAFRQVELQSSQAISDQQFAQRLFQLRCSQ